MTPEALEMSKKYAARVMELEKEVATLTKEVAELREEIHERSNKAMRMIGEITKERDRAYQGSEAQTQEQLAAAQATIERLREALQDIRSHATSTGCRLASKALALPSDTTALQARLKEERERCAKVCEEHSHRDDDMGAIIASAIRRMK